MKKILQAIAFGATLFVTAVSTQAFANDRPMQVFGGTSQPVGHYEFCQRYPDECRKNTVQGLVKLSRSAWDKIVDVNNAVNASIFPKTDEEMWGVPERWSYPSTEGDCEDYSLLKQYMLERAGFPRSALLMTVARQTNGDGHAVLTVRTDRGDFILDNLEDRVLDWKETSYRYLKRQSEQNSAKWMSIADDRDILVGSVR